MLRLAVSVLALMIIGGTAANADMVAGTFSCSNNPARVELLWQGAAPASLLLENSRCGAEGLRCSGSKQAFQDLLERKKCDFNVTEESEDIVFVCVDKANKLTKYVDELCQQAITGPLE